MLLLLVQTEAFVRAVHHFNLRTNNLVMMHIVIVVFLMKLSLLTRRERIDGRSQQQLLFNGLNLTVVVHGGDDEGDRQRWNLTLLADGGGRHFNCFYPHLRADRQWKTNTLKELRKWSLQYYDKHGEYIIREEYALKTFKLKQSRFVNQ